MPPPPRPFRGSRVRRLVTFSTLSLMLLAGLATASATSSTASADTANPPTPGAFTGLGFDQCEAPSQGAMSAWTRSSPFRAVGIYISGNSRACQRQTNLTSTWVRTQLLAGWQLLPITLGPQASCSTRFPRYGASVDPVINSSSVGNYSAARTQASAEADKAVGAASALGIVRNSALFYDIEAWSGSSACTSSAMAFLGAWTDRLHTLGYRSGVYSSGASGIRALDNTRVTPGNTISMPDLLWIADWNGKADVNSAYVRSDGWMPSSRVHQYQGGHNETWGGVTINIDRNYLSLGAGVAPTTNPKTARPAGVACTSKVLNKRHYWVTGPRRNRFLIPTLQCRLKKASRYTGVVTRRWNPGITAAVRSWQGTVGHKQQTRFSRADWRTLRRATR